MSALVVVESPAKVKTLSKFLGEGYAVIASQGHILDLPPRKMGIEVENDFTPTYVVIPAKKKIVAQLKKAAKNKDHVYLASDPDREGEAIAGHIAAQLEKINTNISRVEIFEITKPAIEEAFKHPRSLDTNRIFAQQARRILDRVVGYNLSPLLWKKVSRGLSAGRVQSVVLRMIVDREDAIKKFVPQEYWSVEADLSKTGPAAAAIFPAKLEKIGNEKVEIKNQAECAGITSEIEKQDFVIADVRKSTKKRNPLPPFTTSKMQQEAYNRLHFSVQRTMIIAQQLYEGLEVGDEGSIGLITYMRTDAVRVSVIASDEARKFILENYGKDFVPEKPNIYKSGKQAQAAHEAIRPTSVYRTPEKLKPYLNEDQYKLYKLIWEKFLASQMPAALFAATAVSISAGRFLFKANGSQLVFKGWLGIYPEDPERDTLLPDLFAGEKLLLKQLRPEQHFTQALPRFTDATLVKMMEEEGIGRPSTYAPTIHTIVERNYVCREESALVPTELGILIARLLTQYFPKILDTKFTAEMETELDSVEEGSLGWVQLLKNFYPDFLKTLEVAQQEMKDVKKEVETTDQVCEKCGKPMVIKWGRNGKFLSCSDFPACRFAKAISLGVKCPEEGCGGELVRRRSYKGRFFYGCSRYPQCRHITNKLPQQ